MMNIFTLGTTSKRTLASICDHLKMKKTGKEGGKGRSVLSYGNTCLIGSISEFSGIRGTVTVRESVDNISQAKSLVHAWDDWGVALTMVKLPITGPAREFISVNEQSTPDKTLDELSKALIKPCSIS